MAFSTKGTSIGKGPTNGELGAQISGLKKMLFSYRSSVTDLLISVDSETWSGFPKMKKKPNLAPTHQIVVNTSLMSPIIFEAPSERFHASNRHLMAYGRAFKFNSPLG